MSSFGRIKETIAVFFLVTILVGFIGGFGYLLKTELIDGEGKLSYSIKKMEEDKESKKEDAFNDKDEVNTKAENKLNKEETKVEEKENDSNIKNSSTNKKDETDIQVSGDGVVHKVYPIVTCKNSTPIEDTEVSLNEEYNFYFDTDGSMNWIKFEMSIDYSKYPEVYQAFLDTGYFDLMNEAFKDITISTTITKSKYSLAFELKPEEFIEDVEDSPFKTIKDLHYDNFEKKIKSEGYVCVSE